LIVAWFLVLDEEVLQDQPGETAWANTGKGLGAMQEGLASG
jgi:hypothetical protein